MKENIPSVYRTSRVVNVLEDVGCLVALISTVFGIRVKGAKKFFTEWVVAQRCLSFRPIINSGQKDVLV